MAKKKSKNDMEFSLLMLTGGITYLYTTNIYTSAIVGFIFVAILIAVKQMKKQRQYDKYIKSGIDIVDKMSGEEFEVFLLAHFKNVGYSGDTTPKTQDYGADLILTKNGEKLVVQAKRWNYKVGIEAVQQILGAKSYYKASKCLVITNNFFTPNAKNLADSSDVELWDRNKLLEVMSQANGKQIIDSSLDASNIESRNLCEKCGAELVIRKGNKGSFYGCSNFPKCKFTKNIQ